MGGGFTVKDMRKWESRQILLHLIRMKFNKILEFTSLSGKTVNGRGGITGRGAGGGGEIKGGI